jgi:hypothetical protein
VSDEQTEQATREQAYQRRRTALVVVLALGAVALIAFAIMSYQGFTQRLEAARRLDRATALVEESDAIVVEIDGVVRAKVTPDLATKARAAGKRSDEADRMLAEAIALIDAAAPDLTTDEQERAQLLRTSASTRQAMLDSAPEILDANAQAAAALPQATRGWKDVLEADRLSDKAVASYNKLTKKGVTASKEYNLDAAKVLASAKERFDSAEKSFSAAPFESYLDYVTLRIALNKLSQRSDKAWLADDITKANKLIAEYNREDRRSAKLAEALPATPEEAVADAYDKVTKATTDAYYRARETALKADQELRAF